MLVDQFHNPLIKREKKIKGETNLTLQNKLWGKLFFKRKLKPR